MGELRQICTKDLQKSCFFKLMLRCVWPFSSFTTYIWQAKMTSAPEISLWGTRYDPKRRGIPKKTINILKMEFSI